MLIGGLTAMRPQSTPDFAGLRAHGLALGSDPAAALHSILPTLN